MKPSFGLAAVALLALAACDQKPAGSSGGGGGGGGVGQRQQVWAAGSSTVFPFATRVAENVARSTGGAAAKVESLGTGGGIKLFCTGTGSAYPDVATASRPMKKSEFEECQKNGVGEIVELQFGYDGIVIANAKAGAAYDLTREQLYRGLAAELPNGSGFVKNPATTWNAVDPALPKERIVVYGPPPTSGTRDAFVELAMEAGAKKNPALADLAKSDEDTFKQKAHAIRQDGRWIDSGENDNVIVQTLTKTPGAVGVFGYSFLEENSDQVKGAKVDGVAPTLEAISSGAYPLSRSLFIYVKKANVGVTPGLREFVSAFVSDAAAGRGGYLQQRGLIPLPAEAHAAQKKIAADLQAMAAPAS